MTVAHMWFDNQIIEADTSEDQSSKSPFTITYTSIKFGFKFFSALLAQYGGQMSTRLVGGDLVHQLLYCYSCGLKRGASFHLC